MLLILNKLRQGKRFIPRRELLDYVNDSMEKRYGYQRITGRTLERDIADIDEAVWHRNIVQPHAAGIFYPRKLWRL